MTLNLDNEDLNDVMQGFDVYQHNAAKTAIYPNEAKVAYPILGAIGELGELANKYKKVIRDGAELDLEDATKELGDVLWYLSAIATDLGVSLGYIASGNLLKLADRSNRGVLGGSGDTR